MNIWLELIIGVVLAVPCIWLWQRWPDHFAALTGVGLLGAVAIYPAVGLFMGVPLSEMPIQLGTFLPAMIILWLGIKWSVGFIAFGWLAHGPWDMLIHHAESIAHMPDWYPAVCLGFDLYVGGYLALHAAQLWSRNRVA